MNYYHIPLYATCIPRALVLKLCAELGCRMQFIRIKAPTREPRNDPVTYKFAVLESRRMFSERSCN